jgi:hypothetical protein
MKIKQQTQAASEGCSTFTDEIDPSKYGSILRTNRYSDKKLVLGLPAGITHDMSRSDREEEVVIPF